jgi:hypothetical protein
MKNSLRLITIPVVTWFSLGMGAAQAGLFNGLTVNYPYYFPNLTIPYSTANTSNYLIDSSKKVSSVVGSYDTINLSSDSSAISFIQGSSFSLEPFNRFIISNILSVSAIDHPYASFNSITDIDALAPPLYVNWQDSNLDEENLAVTAVNLETTTNPIPEPETHAMLIVGLGLIGYTLRRRRIAG